ncbi:Zinc finger C2H2-type, partial [Trinorchestia longiramus]
MSITDLFEEEPQTTIQHKMKRTFECQQCDFTTTSRISLSRHTAARHSTARPFLCSLCEKSFKIKTILQRHIRRRHSPPAPCNPSDASKLQLKTLFKCMHCLFVTAHKSSLHCHQFLHVDDELACDMCNYTTKSPKTLSKHKLSHLLQKRLEECCSIQAHSFPCMSILISFLVCVGSRTRPAAASDVDVTVPCPGGAQENDVADDNPNSTAGDNPNSAAGDNPNSTAGDNLNSTAGDNPNSTAGDNPNSTAGDNPNSTAGDNPNSTAGDNPNSEGVICIASNICAASAGTPHDFAGPDASKTLKKSCTVTCVSKSTCKIISSNDVFLEPPPALPLATSYTHAHKHKKLASGSTPPGRNVCFVNDDDGGVKYCNAGKVVKWAAGNGDLGEARGSLGTGKGETEEPPRFRCRYCPLTFVDAISRRHHALGHRQEMRFGCRLCGYRTDSSSVLKFHVRRHLNKGGLVSEDNGMLDEELLSKYTDVLPQKKKKKKTTNLCCTLCDFTCVGRSTLVRHRTMTHPDHPGIRCR